MERTIEYFMSKICSKRVEKKENSCQRHLRIMRNDTKEWRPNTEELGPCLRVDIPDLLHDECDNVKKVTFSTYVLLEEVEHWWENTYTHIEPKGQAIT
ncbi:hypothetical protein CR513_01739, partial [Mucuna pruriens]